MRGKKTDWVTKITESENKITSFTGFVTTSVLNTKATETVNKIPDVTNLATEAALNTKAAEAESKIRDITLLTTKAAQIQAIEIESRISDTTRFLTTPEFNRLTKISFDTKWKKQQIALQVKDNALDVADKNREKIKKNFRRLSYFNDKNFFDNDGSQNYLMSQLYSLNFTNFFLAKVSSREGFIP